MMKLNRIWVSVFFAALPAYLLAGDQAAGSGEVAKLQRDIEMTMTREQDIKKRNAELQAKMKELESRIMELRKTLIQEGSGSADQ